jgi:predicted metalloendopeptidase
LNINPSGLITVTEDTADNGGVKLAYKAYNKWLNASKQKQSHLIALQFTPQQLFWISYAQFYCTVQRKQLKKILVDIKDPHSFDYFRVMGPLLNSNEFFSDFKCPLHSNMNQNRTKCTIW